MLTVLFYFYWRADKHEIKKNVRRLNYTCAEYASPAVRLSRDFGAKIFQKSSHDDPDEASSWPARGGPAW